MFKCDDCGRTFREPDLRKEPMEKCFGHQSYKLVYGCPYCDGSFRELDPDEESEESEEDEDAEVH